MSAKARAEAAEFAARLQRAMLGPPRRTLAVAESVTCGGIQARVGRISGASEFFLGGITAYSAAIKVRHLGVDGAAAAPVNSVSAEIAAQMARGVCAMFGADFGLATTGYAEPNAEWGVAAPFAYWAVAFAGPGAVAAVGAPAEARGVVATGRVDCTGCGRAEAQDRIADEALRALAAVICREPVPRRR